MGYYSRLAIHIANGGDESDFPESPDFKGDGSGAFHDVYDLRSIFGGEVSGNKLLCPGPDHSSVDRSMCVTIDPSAEGGVLVNSFSTRTPAREAFDYFIRELAKRALSYSAEEGRALLDMDADGYESSAGPRPATTAPEKSDEEKIREARSIWTHASTRLGDDAIAYLHSRRLPVLGPDIMRYQAYAPWGKNDYAPQLILAFRDVKDGSIRGIHRTKLPHLGSNPERRTLGPIGKGRGAIMLTPYAEVMAAGEVAISEGWESGLAALELGRKNVWAVFSSGNVASFPVLPGIRRLTILTEDCDANREAQNVCIPRWDDAGREVFRAKPSVGKDFADVLMEARL